MTGPLDILWFLLVVVGLIVALWAGQYVLIRRNRELGNERLLGRQLVMLALGLIGVVVVLLALPVPGDIRTHLMALFGLLLSAIVAFSSSTIFANMMAGMMLRFTRPYRTGDFVTVGEFAGRVSQQGLFDTEIQSVDRELVAIPHTYMIARPVAVQPRAESMVSVEVSLGYDLHHGRIEDLLLAAANACELEQPFVQILSLGDFTVSYKVSGRLVADDALITARSNLHRQVLDVLHGAGVEIMSPAFVNQRRLPEGHSTVPTSLPTIAPAPQTAAEAVVFDKAEAAVAREEQIAALEQRIEKLKVEQQQADEQQRVAVQEQLVALQERMQQLKDVQGA